ncbi:unnamed protein product [Linum tenue]|uniref:Uncharacterized protein n=1 Tax=Linum tenue TaxID=586396 RepID=A0AAV0NVI0_9ROSI|nr:unnamed protein product [Linum tenue]
MICSPLSIEDFGAAARDKGATSQDRSEVAFMTGRDAGKTSVDGKLKTKAEKPDGSGKHQSAVKKGHSEDNIVEVSVGTRGKKNK